MTMPYFLNCNYLLFGGSDETVNCAHKKIQIVLLWQCRHPPFLVICIEERLSPFARCDGFPALENYYGDSVAMPVDPESAY